MSAILKKPIILRQSSYNSLYSNPLIDPKIHNKNSSETNTTNTTNSPPKTRHFGAQLCINNTNFSLKDSKTVKKPKQVSNFGDDNDDDNANKENNVLPNQCDENPKSRNNCRRNDRILKPSSSSSSSSLQMCIQMNEPESSFGFGLKVWEGGGGGEEETGSCKSVNVWDFSDSEAAPVSSWSTLPNRRRFLM